MRTYLLALFLASFSLYPTTVLAIERKLAEWPPQEGPLRVLIDTDAACEIDDLYAIALALVSTDRFDIEGFIGAHFGDAGGPEGAMKSVQAIKEVLAKGNVSDRFPVKLGAPPFQFSQVPPNSEGVDYIIERAMAGTPENPLWIVSLGACTDVVAAYLKRPEIADRVIVFWHGRTQWPVKCWNFNAYNDLKAVRILFQSELPLVLFDTGTYLRYPMENSEQNVLSHGELGKYLHEFRLTNKHYQSPQKGFFDLGDIAALVDPSLTYSEVVAAPGVDWDMRYDRRKAYGRIVRIYQIDRDRTFQIFSQRLKDFSSRP